jgi:hypothetical protein
MKPSEYLIKEGYWIISDMPNTKLEDGEGYRVDSVADELDNKFINREELKEKINEIDIWNKNGLKVKKEILELLK